MADFFFTASGIGLSLLRIQVIPGMAECESFGGGGKCVKVGSGATILKGELAVARQAVRRGVKVWCTPWSPPASMKSNGSFVNGGELLPAYYAAWAESLAGYVRLLDSNGIPIYAMSVQNEPDLAVGYGSALFSARELHGFVPYLRSALKANGVGKTEIIIAEASHWDFSLTKTAMADPKVAGDVDILAAHGYASARPAPQVNYGKHVWQTEDSSQASTYDGSMTDALAWASKIDTYLTVAQVNAWNWWFLSDGPKYGNGRDNSALTDIDLNYPKRAYVTGQWSKFVRPGWYRIGVRCPGPLQVSAFKDAKSRSFAIVVVNNSSKDLRRVFALDGFETKSVSPWITSPTLSLAPRARVAVTGSAFSYALPARSVVTFFGIADE